MTWAARGGGRLETRKGRLTTVDSTKGRGKVNRGRQVINASDHVYSSLSFNWDKFVGVMIRAVSF